MRDLAWTSTRARNLVSHHLRLLRSHGLVTSRRGGEPVLFEGARGPIRLRVTGPDSVKELILTPYTG